MRKGLSYFVLFICLGTSFLLQGQSLEDRQKIQSQLNPERIRALRAELERSYTANERAVADYLANNPDKKRSFTKDGNLYYIQRILPNGQPLYINTKSNVASGELIRANQLYTDGSIGVNITGTGMVAGVWDGGLVRETHELLTGKVQNQPGQVSVAGQGGDDHMSHCTGTMVGRFVASQPTARGIAFDATTRNWDWNNDTNEMTAFAGDGFLISNHSYGYGNDENTPVWTFGAYDVTAVAWDNVLAANPMYLPFIAGGNEQQSNGNGSKNGYDIITGSSAAKNAMTVGAVNADESMSDYSNWGPTDDGRVKPEIVTRGTGINSAQATSDNAYSGDSDASSGTSYAAPAAAAGALLLQQYYRSLNPTYMRAATLKGLIMHTAKDLGQTGPDSKFGWGLMNVEAAAQAIKNRGDLGETTSKGAYFEELTTNPANNNTAEITRRFFAKGGEPLIVSISWTDEPGTEQLETESIDPTAVRLVHNFDLMVRQVGGPGEFRPWKPVSMANRTDAAGLQTGWFDGNFNNYKQVRIATPIADGEYEVAIRKASTSPAGDLPFSLLITGLKENAAQAVPAISIAVAPASLEEDAPVNSFIFTFTSSIAPANDLTVNFTVGGTATFNDDYLVVRGANTFTATNGSVVIPAGQTTASITIQTVPDNIVEADESIILTVVAP
ncbi:MAG: S8 family serine peptidase [Bernardetiaceae bacterium]